MRISDWSSDVCSSDLHLRQRGGGGVLVARFQRRLDLLDEGTDAANAVGVDLRATVVPPDALLRLWRVRHACPRVCSMKKGAGNSSRRTRKAGPLPIWGVPVNLKLRRSEERGVGTECARTCSS